MKSNQTVFEIDKTYRDVLRGTCKYVLSFNKRLPIDWEDIYNSFLFDAPKILEEFNEELKISEKTYLVIKCKYFGFNYCKRFTGNKHKTLNYSLNDYDITKYVSNFDVEINESLDTSAFSSLEYLIYKEHFLNGLPLRQLSNKHKLSYYKVRSLVGNIKAKLLLQLK